jgi:hypothetical protein
MQENGHSAKVECPFLGLRTILHPRMCASRG